MTPAKTPVDRPSVPRTAAGRDFVQTMRTWFIDSDGTFDEDAIAMWTGDILDIEAEAAVLDHPRTYSLTASGPNGELFLVTDDESGINIGHAKKIGGPLTAAASTSATSDEEEEAIRHSAFGGYQP